MAGDGASPTFALLRLLQITDSSFPVGGFAYSHGLEWFAANRRPGEADLAELLEAYLAQVGGGQWLPAALAAYRAASPEAVRRADDSLDASIVSAAEREAGRAMGERLLSGAFDAFAIGPESIVSEFRTAVQSSATPGQYAVAFGVVSRAEGVGEREMLTALAFAMAGSVTQAAVRLNLIGQQAAGRLVAGTAGRIGLVIERTLLHPTPRRFGAFTPMLDVGAILQPTLTFRMFAS